MPSRPKKKPSKKKQQKHYSSTAQPIKAIIQPSLPTIQIHVQESFVETNSQARVCFEKELSGCVTCQDHSCRLVVVEEEEQAADRQKLSEDHQHQMADSSNGKVEETHQEVQEGEAVRDIAIDDYSIEHANKKAEQPADEETTQVVGSGEKEEEEVVPVSETSVVDDVVEVEEKEEEKEYVPSVDETDEPSAVVEDVKTLTDLVSNGVEESITLPPLSEDITNVVSKGIEETEVPCSDEKQEEEEEEEVVPVVTDVVSKGIEEVKLPAAEEISTGESSGDAYKVTNETADDESLKPSPEVPVPPPVESADASEQYGKREISETTETPSIVSVTRAPLQPTSWRSCCGLFEVLRRSDR